MPKRTQNAPEEFSQYERTLAKEIGARIRLRRKELGLTQEQVRTNMAAESVLVSRSHFSRIEFGEYLPSASQVLALVKVLEVSYGWLLAGEDNGIIRRPN